MNLSPPLSNLRPRLRPPHPAWLVAGGTLFVVAVYIGLASRQGRPGFPLDDAWIHQTYARNLIRSGRWEFVPGVVSTGSTAPLWTLLVAVGYALRLPYLLWVYLLGVLSLWLTTAAAMRLWHQLWPGRAERDWLVGLALVFTWPLVWAAASGMETLLFAALSLSILALFYERTHTPAGIKASFRVSASMGLLAGLLILTRPDGLVLVLLIATAMLLQPRPWRTRAGAAVVYAAAVALPLLPYFAFNLWTSGHIWPNTFYAKQAEYSALLLEPFLTRLARLLYFSLGGPPAGWRGISGAHLLLVPGVVMAALLALQDDWSRRRLWKLLPLLWAGGHIWLYAWRLPVTYQHGRYLLAALPIWVVFGLEGWHDLLAHAGAGQAARLGRTAAGFTFALMLVIFWLLGANAYADDVAFVEGEMVTVAHWLAQNTPADALIAAHDIGAIGYFAERPLLDLAGLVSPDVASLLGDEAALNKYILASDAHYLVTAPGWPYAAAVQNDAVTLEFTTSYAWTQEQGLNNMTVYRLAAP